MQTVEIPREAWVATLDEFTAIHEGWLVSLEVLGPEIGAQPAMDNLPLFAVSADRPDRGGTITISAARATGEHMTHTIHGASRVYIERTDEGADAALQIESGDGTRAILRFRTAARPETLDGIAHR